MSRHSDRPILCPFVLLLWAYQLAVPIPLPAPPSDEPAQEAVSFNHHQGTVSHAIGPLSALREHLLTQLYRPDNSAVEPAKDLIDGSLLFVLPAFDAVRSYGGAVGITCEPAEVMDLYPAGSVIGVREAQDVSGLLDCADNTPRLSSISIALFDQATVENDLLREAEHIYYGELGEVSPIKRH